MWAELMPGLVIVDVALEVLVVPPSKIRQILGEKIGLLLKIELDVHFV